MTKAALLTALIATIGFVTFSVADIDHSTGRHILLAALLLFLFAVQFEFLMRFYRYFLYIIIVTDRRVHRIKRTLITVDEHECVDLWALQEINKFQHGVVQNIFGFGSLRLEAQDTRLTLHFVPQIDMRYREIMHLVERARQERRRIMK